jgi:hypothetical protein
MDTAAMQGEDNNTEQAGNIMAALAMKCVVFLTQPILVGRQADG